MNFKDNILLNSDSYKASHYLQYPPNTEYVFSYIESRGGVYPKTLFFGLQILLKDVLSKPITQEMIEEAAQFWAAHGEPFNLSGWEYILNEHNGYLPLKIRAVPEGTVVPTNNVLVTVENTDPKCYWLSSYVETMILRSIWYPTTVATISWSIKQILRDYLESTGSEGSLNGLPFQLHDFGARGVSSFESSGIGGAAHLVNFMGTDNVTGAFYAQQYYNEDNVVAFSVPAAEHSSMTTWGKENEGKAFKNMFDQFGSEGAIVSVVSDSYDIYNAVENLWGEELRQQVIDSGATLVIRPDSGDPSSVVTEIAQMVDQKFGSTVNEKGYKVLNNVRILQGDGIDESEIRRILIKLTNAGYSAENMVFGQGGALLQHCNRDTQKFAYKASAAKINGKWIDVYKDPVTDSGKRSKKGKVNLFRDQNGDFVSGRIEHIMDQDYNDAMVTVFENGKILKEYTFTEIRERSEQ